MLTGERFGPGELPTKASFAITGVKLGQQFAKPSFKSLDNPAHQGLAGNNLERGLVDCKWGARSFLCLCKHLDLRLLENYKTRFSVLKVDASFYRPVR